MISQTNGIYLKKKNIYSHFHIIFIYFIHTLFRVQRPREKREKEKKGIFESLAGLNFMERENALRRSI